MKTLPSEVWTMIARHTKRPQPPPRVKADWNDNFNQQDLVSLMRVCKSMYQIVAPILYDEPIVQNIGLFFLGVEQPIPSQNEPNDQVDSVNQLANETETETARSIPYHKRQLLDLVKKINIIRASSSTPLDKCYMENTYHEYEGNDSYLNEMSCDRLGREDVEGCILAKSILKRLVEQTDSKLPWQSAFPLISFRHLTILTCGLWDDGRWAIYEDNANERIYKYNADEPIYSDDDLGELDTIAENDTSASAYMVCEEIISAFFFRTIVKQAVTLCHHAELGLNIFTPQSSLLVRFEPMNRASALSMDSGSYTDVETQLTTKVVVLNTTT